MILTVADLLDALAKKEREKLPDFKRVPHTGIFGRMYEGLTQTLLEKALFKGLDLRVVSGFIWNSKGIPSKQIDCMVVVGDGEAIPYTPDFNYPLSQVVMIVQVTKTLTKQKLQTDLELFQHFWANVAESGPPQTGLVKDAWRSLFRRNLPESSELENLPFAEQQIYHSILAEAVYPLRVLFAFDGYSDEFALREGLVGYLDAVTRMPLAERPRFNVNTVPNLIVCRNASLIKLDGMPYPGEVDAKGYWWCMASRGEKPFQILLELLWTRLVFRFNLSAEIFGEDLEMEAVTKLLAAKPELSEGRSGWTYQNAVASRDLLSSGKSTEEWHPPTLTIAEYHVVNILCTEGEIDVSDSSFLKFLSDAGATVEALCASLNDKKLTTLAGNKLHLITDGCGCMILTDGRLVAGENKTGRLQRYALKVAEKTRGEKKKAAVNPE